MHVNARQCTSMHDTGSTHLDWKSAVCSAVWGLVREGSTSVLGPLRWCSSPSQKRANCEHSHEDLARDVEDRNVAKKPAGVQWQSVSVKKLSKHHKASKSQCRSNSGTTQTYICFWRLKCLKMFLSCPKPRPCEFVRVHGGRSDDELEIVPSANNWAQHLKALWGVRLPMPSMFQTVCSLCHGTFASTIKLYRRRGGLSACLTLMEVFQNVPKSLFPGQRIKVEHAIYIDL